MRARFIALMAMFCASSAGADSLLPNIPRVFTGPSGSCYAETIPDESYGTEGVTRVYRAQGGAGELIATYPWFTLHVDLRCDFSRHGESGALLARSGPLGSSYEASDEDLAFAFYFRGVELARISTLDIAGDPDNVTRTMSHYFATERIIGLETYGESYVFTVETIDHRELSFDVLTGDLVM